MISVSSGHVGLKSLMTKLHKSSHYSPSAALLMLILTQHSTVNRVILHQISLELALSTFAGQIGLQIAFWRQIGQIGSWIWSKRIWFAVTLIDLLRTVAATSSAWRIVWVSVGEHCSYISCFSNCSLLLCFLWWRQTWKKLQLLTKLESFWPSTH